MSEFNVNKYKDPDECNAAWNLRRRFLLAHHDRFPLERLICLAQCFVNHELYGCKYPTQVMILLKEFTKDMPHFEEERKSRVKSKYASMTFVKAESEKESESEGKKESSTNRTVETKMAFVKAESEYKSTDIKSSTYQSMNSNAEVSANKRPHFTLDTVVPKKKSKKGFFIDPLTFAAEGEGNQLFAFLRYHIQRIQPGDEANQIPRLSVGVQRSKSILRSEFEDIKDEKGRGPPFMFACKVFINDIYVARGRDKNKKLAKRLAFSNAVAKILKPYHMLVMNENNESELLASDDPFQSPVDQTEDSKAEEDGEKLNGEEEELHEELSCETNAGAIGLKNFQPNQELFQSGKGLDEFIFLINQVSSSNEVGLLNQSANFSKMLIQYNYQKCAAGVSCRIALEGQPLVEATADHKAAAKAEASESAVDLLKMMCWTIKVKQAADSDDASLSKDEILGDVEKSLTVIPDSNVGNKLLRKMGWSGGGVGKDGTGRAEPVVVDQVVHRAGLGLDVKAGISVDFKDKIKKCIDNYVKSDNPDDFVFAPDFRKEERAIIHQYCQRLGLKSRSHGSGENRYLVISRKRTPVELFHHIMSKGGSTSKYELVPPRR